MGSVLLNKEISHKQGSQESLAPVEDSTAFYRRALGVQLVRQVKLAGGICIMNDLAAPGQPALLIEMIRSFRRNGSHLAYVVPDVNGACRTLEASGAVVCQPSREGSMACVLAPNGVCAELIQRGAHAN